LSANSKKRLSGLGHNSREVGLPVKLPAVKINFGDYLVNQGLHETGCEIEQLSGSNIALARMGREREESTAMFLNRFAVSLFSFLSLAAISGGQIATLPKITAVRGKFGGFSLNS
jgi:hypothetical protein